MKCGCEELRAPRGRRGERVLLGQRQHGHLVRREAVVQAQHGAGLAAHLLLVVGREEERHHRAGGAGRRLDHVRARSARWWPGRSTRASRPSALACWREVVVAAVGDALELVPAPREEELHVGGARRVVRQLVGVVRPQAQLVGGDAEVEVPAEALARTSTRTTAALSSGGTKNSISICSNSRVRKTKLPGVISLRNDLPTWAMPNGGFLRDVSSTFAKLTNMPCAVSGRR